ncbi:MAG: sulfoxide reductase heme-binding subunit YedZ [Chloroflexi bacterium]|nr:sulfoxide reductase heme-binding subunit YedZ [Chloroflexota bacterium]
MRTTELEKHPDQKSNTRGQRSGRARAGVLRLPFGIELTWLQLVVHICCWLPLIVLVWEASHDLLSVNPIQDITFRTGRTALVILVLSLACTPANNVLGFKQALKLRRPLGLYGFMYAGLHFLIFSVLDYQLDWELIQQTIVEKRYVLVGFAALLLLLPLAITSSKGWMKRLGKNWRRLHALVYLAVPLAVIHFVWLVKADIRVPLQYGAVVALLLVLRIPRVRQFFSQLRFRLMPRRKPATTGRGAAPAVIAQGESTSRSG